jgi:hypothetical protein
MRRSGGATAVGVALLAASCGSPPLHEVTGRVTLDGKPLEAALVTYISDDDRREFFLARTDAEGRYRLQPDGRRAGALAGRYVVRVTTLQEADTRSEPPVPGIAERVPRRYNLESELRAEVDPGVNDRSFDLVTEERR